MRRVFICCEVFKPEIIDLFSRTRHFLSIVCISSEYHNDPKKLRVKFRRK